MKRGKCEIKMSQKEISFHVRKWYSELEKNSQKSYKIFRIEIHSLFCDGNKKMELECQYFQNVSSNILLSYRFWGDWIQI